MLRFNFLDDDTKRVALDVNTQESTFPCQRVTCPVSLDGLRVSEEPRSGLMYVDEPHSTAADVIPGQYEGGLKLWECSVDLVEHLRAMDLKGRSVLELGCGHALPAVEARRRGAAEVVVQDFNESVLRAVTAGNMALAGMEDAELVAGPWRSLPEYLAGRTFDVILAADTIYTERSLGDFVAAVRAALAPNGEALVAAKTYYFGVPQPGGTAAFRREVQTQCGGAAQCETVRKFSDGTSNIREIISMRIS